MRIEVAVVVLLRGEQVWMRMRQGTGHLDGYWEFPGGKIRESESPGEAARRELVEETSVELPEDVLEWLMATDYEYAERVVRIHFFSAAWEASHSPSGGEWVSLRDIANRPTPPANRGVIDMLLGDPRSHFSENGRRDRSGVERPKPDDIR